MRRPDDIDATSPRIGGVRTLPRSGSDQMCNSYEPRKLAEVDHPLVVWWLQAGGGGAGGAHGRRHGYLPSPPVAGAPHYVTTKRREMDNHDAILRLLAHSMPQTNNKTRNKLTAHLAMVHGGHSATRATPRPTASATPRPPPTRLHRGARTCTHSAARSAKAHAGIAHARRGAGRRAPMLRGTARTRTTHYLTWAPSATLSGATFASPSASCAHTPRWRRSSRRVARSS